MSALLKKTGENPRGVTVPLFIEGLERTLLVPLGYNLWTALVEARLMSPVGCNYRGRCGVCEVEILAGDHRYPALACEVTVNGPMRIYIPPREPARAKTATVSTSGV